MPLFSFGSCAPSTVARPCSARIYAYSPSAVPKCSRQRQRPALRRDRKPRNAVRRQQGGGRIGARRRSLNNMLMNVAQLLHDSCGGGRHGNTTLVLPQLTSGWRFFKASQPGSRIKESVVFGDVFDAAAFAQTRRAAWRRWRPSASPCRRPLSSGSTGSGRTRRGCLWFTVPSHRAASCSRRWRRWLGGQRRAEGRGGRRCTCGSSVTGGSSAAFARRAASRTAAVTLRPRSHR